MKNPKKTVQAIALMLAVVIGASACSVEIEKEEPSDTTVESSETTN